jgi:hypothetical protein
MSEDERRKMLAQAFIDAFSALSSTWAAAGLPADRTGSAELQFGRAGIVFDVSAKNEQNSRTFSLKVSQSKKAAS